MQQLSRQFNIIFRACIDTMSSLRLLVGRKAAKGAYSFKTKIIIEINTSSFLHPLKIFPKILCQFNLVRRRKFT